MPQTREHFDICRLLRVPAGLIALTKADLVDADTLELARLEVRRVSWPDRFSRRAPVLPVCRERAQGLDDRGSALVRAAHAVTGRSPARSRTAPIDRVFSMKGFGTVVTGTLVSGRIAVDDRLVVAPGERRVKVRGVQVHGAKRPSRRRRAHGRESRRHRRRGNRPRAEPGDRRRLRGDAACRRDRRRASRREAAEARRARAVSSGDRGDPGTRRASDRSPQRRAAGPAPQASARGLGPATGPQLVPSGARGIRSPEARSVRRPRARGSAILRAYSPPVTIAGGHVSDPETPRTAVRRRPSRASVGSRFDPAAEGRPAPEQRADARHGRAMRARPAWRRRRWRPEPA